MLIVSFLQKKVQLDNMIVASRSCPVFSLKEQSSKKDKEKLDEQLKVAKRIIDNATNRHKTSV